MRSSIAWLAFFEQYAPEAMLLQGTIFFDFESADSFRLFWLLASAEQEGAELDVVWRARPAGDQPGSGELDPWETALAAHALVRESGRQERFRRALFIAIHRQGDSPPAQLTYRAAARVAGIDADVLLGAVARAGRGEVETARRHAVDAGISAVPTVVGDGPALHVATTPAIENGRAIPRLQVIAAMLDDDGLWRMVKP